MKKTEQIIIDADPSGVLKALVTVNDVSAEYDVKEFTYSMKKLNPEMIGLRDMDEYKITHCRIVMVKK